MSLLWINFSINLNVQEAREIGRNFPGVDLGMKKTKNSFHEGGNELDNNMSL